MNFILRTAPSFLRKADAYLRINHSWIWSTKIHIHLYMTVILGAVFSLVGLLYHVDIRWAPDRSDLNGFFILLFIPAVIFCFYMLYNMSLFNTDKSYAYRFKYQEFFLFIIYFFTFCLPLVIPYSASLILNYRVDRLVDDVQFKKDQVAYNEALPFFPVNSDDYEYYPSDSVYLFETRERAKKEREGLSEYSNHYEFWESMKDSVFSHTGIFEKTRPKLYYHHSLNWNTARHHDHYDLFSNRRYDYRDPDYLSVDYNFSGAEDSLYAQYIEHTNLVHDPAMAEKHIAEMDELLKKYTVTKGIERQKIRDQYAGNYYIPEEARVQTDAREALMQLTEMNISSIHSAKMKYAYVFDGEIYLGLWIFIFCLTVLFLLFKNVHWKQFLLAIAINAALLTLVIIIEVISNGRGEFIGALAVLLPLIFLFVTIAGFYINRFSWFFNQVNIFLTVILPFYPLIVLSYLQYMRNIFEIEYFDRYKIPVVNSMGYTEWLYNTEYYELINTIWTWTFIGSILLYVFVWNSYLKLLYLRYWSLPKNR